MKKPCKECPFNKKANLTINELGGSSPSVYMGQAHYAFWLPCHLDKSYEGKNSHHLKVTPCIGAAIFRSKLSVRDKFPKSDIIPVLEDVGDYTFNTPSEFMSHYLNINADEISTPECIESYVKEELNKINQSNILWKK